MAIIMDAEHYNLIPKANQPAFDEWVNNALAPYDYSNADCSSTRQDQGGYVFTVFKKNAAGRHYAVGNEVAAEEILVHCDAPPDLNLDPDVATWLAVQ